jgi:hypothetical protein
MVNWQVREKAEKPMGGWCFTSEGGRANEKQGGKHLFSRRPVARSTARFFLILFDGRTSNKELCILREGFFSIIKIASRY